MKTITTDIVVVGAGASGLIAAIAAHRLGKEVVVIESTDRVGGSTATSGGLMWLPGNSAMKKLGASDTPEDAADYLNHVLGATTEVSSADRRRAFLRTAPWLARWLEQSHLNLSAVKDQSDYFSDAPGYSKQGRALLTPTMDRRILGPWADQIRLVEDTPDLGGITPRALVASARELAGRLFSNDPNVSAGGGALVAQLLNRALGTGVMVWTESPMTELLSSDGRVTGVRLTRGAEDVELLSNDAVLLACGGFEASQDEREEHLPLPTDAAWSLGTPGNDGRALTAAQAVGAAVAGLHDAWWVPVIRADGRSWSIDGARRRPNSIIVDQAGYRFVNESAPSVRVGKAMYDRNRSVRAVPSYLIIDNRHRSRYQLGPWLPGATPKSAQDDGEIVRAATLNDLAEALGIDRAGLLGTVVRFNGFAAKGNDQDFNRGATDFERSRGDATKRRNPCLGGIEKAPYWGIPVYPGDRGTKGGVLIDAASQVLRPDGSVLPGLYACGGAAASMLKSTSPAEGAALAVACVEAFRAALAICGQLERVDNPSATPAS